MKLVRVKRETPTGPVTVEVEVEDEAAVRILHAAIKGHDPTVEAPPVATVAPGGKRARSTSRAEPLSETEVARLRERVPSKEAVAEFILSQKGRSHSLADITARFLEAPVRSNPPTHAEKQLFWMMQDRMIGARRIIETKDKSGKFVEDGVRKVGHSRVYSWKAGS